ncbi:MAG: lipid-A-disaccharide synthase [Pseudomonadota bacterium]|nr:lipid-A-disaccharide synthase [Pseudomonadota bacterium]
MANGPRIALVAGEVSGDILGGDLLRVLRQRYPNARFEGIGGSEMLAAGLEPLADMEQLSVMGLVEVLGRLPQLVLLRRRIGTGWLADPPDLFVGIDAPDFNLGLERRLRAGGIPTAHYVSPSVWAWRRGRVRKIARSVDLMLTLFPFEAKFYAESGVPVAFVGHPLADNIPMFPDPLAARRALDLEGGRTVLAVLPGSRAGEVERLAPVFLEAVARLVAMHPRLQVVIPCATASLHARLSALVESSTSPPIRVVLGESRTAMAAANVVLVASGTATLEALLLKRPMVVAYAVSPWTYRILSRLVHSEFVALPNLLAERGLVPELLQHDATPEKLAEAVNALLVDENKRTEQTHAFEAIHRALARDAGRAAADALGELLRDPA